MSSAADYQPISVHDYLAGELAARHKHEYVDRQGYLDIGVVTVLCPLAGMLTVIAPGTALGSF